MRKSAFPALPIVILALVAGPAAAHGLVSRIDHGTAVIVTITHEDGSPLVLTPFDVLPPDRDSAFIEGRTDDQGRVGFVPDRPGTWRVRVMATDGHGTVVPVEVDADLASAAGGGQGGNSGFMKAVSGVAILFGVFGVVVLAQRRRS